MTTRLQEVSQLLDELAGQPIQRTNASAVSRILSKQFNKSESSATRIRGWHHTSTGFEVTQGHTNVWVKFIYKNTDASRDSWKRAAEMREQMLPAYATLLASKGYETEIRGEYVKVTKRQAA